MRRKLWRDSEACHAGGVQEQIKKLREKDLFRGTNVLRVKEAPNPWMWIGGRSGKQAGGAI